MLKFEITDSSAVEAFNRLIAMGEDPSGPLLAIGEVLTERVKQGFADSKDPYGTPWVPNSDTTLRTMLHGRSGSFTGKGKLSKKGTALLVGKKPLIGESKTLSTQLHYQVIDTSVVITDTAVQAAMMNFGGTKAEFPHLWGDIPARPIFPDAAIGLPVLWQEDVIDVLRAAAQAAIDGN